MAGSPDSRSPTLELLVVIGAVFVLQQLVALVSQPIALGLFTLRAPILADPWALVISVYATAGSIICSQTPSRWLSSASCSNATRPACGFTPFSW